MAISPSDIGDLKFVDWQALARVQNSTPIPKAAPPVPKRALWEAERRELVMRKLALEMETIRLYEAIPLGEVLHRSMAMWTIADGCMDGSQTIYDPVQRSLRRVDSIDGDFHVYSINPDTGNREVRRVSKPFIKGHADMYRFTFSNGHTFSGTMGHRVVAVDGHWITLREALREGIALCHAPCPANEEESQSRADLAPQHQKNSESVPQSRVSIATSRRKGHAVRRQGGRTSAAVSRHLLCVSGLRASTVSAVRTSEGDYAQQSPEAVPDSRSCCLCESRSCGERPLSPSGIVRDASPSQAGAEGHKGERNFGCSGDEGHTARCIHLASSGHLSNVDLDGQRMAQPTWLGDHTFAPAEESSVANTGTSPRFSSRSDSHHNTACEESLHQSWDAASHPPSFKWNNRHNQCSIIHAEKIASKAAIWDISVPPHANYVAGGLINANSNRAGKTCSCAAEAAYALLGCHPHGKYVKKNGKAWFVGLTEHHLILMYNALFKPGAFRLIRDEQTKLWRTLRWDRANPGHLQPYDEAYKEQSIEAPPFIPQRAAATSWRDKATGIPNVTRFTNGWEVIWSPGGGIPEQGWHYNFWWFDEEMENPEVYKEALRGGARLVHESFLQMPRGIWSATSQIANPELAALREKADQDPESTFAKRITYLMRDNPYLHEKTEATLREGYSDADIATRIEGIPSSTYHRVYPSYNPMGAHGVEQFDIPKDWCIWAVTDPGRVRCATIFDTIDPDEAFHTVYSGFEVQHGDAHEWAKTMKAHETKMGRRFQGIVFDQQRGRQTLDSLWSKTVAEQYWIALCQEGVVPMSTGNVKGMGGFFPGLNNVEARERALINMMVVRTDGPFEGTAKFRVVRGAVPMLDKQIRQARTDPKNPEKRFESKQQPDDWMDACEYLAAFDPRYHPPEVPSVVPVNHAVADFKAKQKYKAKRRALLYARY